MSHPQGETIHCGQKIQASKEEYGIKYVYVQVCVCTYRVRLGCWEINILQEGNTQRYAHHLLFDFKPIIR